jgi:hypothetical protein
MILILFFGDFINKQVFSVTHKIFKTPDKFKIYFLFNIKKTGWFLSVSTWKIMKVYNVLFWWCGNHKKFAMMIEQLSPWGLWC